MTREDLDARFERIACPDRIPTLGVYVVRADVINDAVDLAEWIEALVSDGNACEELISALEKIVARALEWNVAPKG